MDVEEGKKENRSLGTFNFKLQDFIKRYKNEDIYMVESLPKSMKGNLIHVITLENGHSTVLSRIKVELSVERFYTVIMMSNYTERIC